MTVSKRIDRNEHSAVTLTLSVAKDSVQAEYDALIKDYASKMQIKGFRKGKVPRDILERKFGEAFKGEALGRIMEKALEEELAKEDFPADAKPLAYSTPSVQGEPKLDLDNDLEFSLRYDAYPLITLGQWKGLSIQAPTAKVEAADVDNELEHIRERNAVVLDKDENDLVASGDVVTIDYAELKDAEIVEDTAREDFTFTVGGGNTPYHLDDDIIGMKNGETRELTKSFGADDADPSLQGKTVSLKISVKALKEKKLPALDDDLAQDVSEDYKSLADLKADVKAKLERNLEKRLRELKIEAYMDKVLEGSSIDLPESMIRLELEARWRQMANNFNVDPERLYNMLQASGKSYEALIDEWRPSTEKAIKSRLILETIMKDFNLEINEADLENELVSMADNMRISLDEIKKHYADNRMKEYLKDDLKERRLYDLLLAETTIKVGKKMKYLDLMSEKR